MDEPGVRITEASTPGVEAPHCADGVSLALMTSRNFTLNTEYLIVKEHITCKLWTFQSYIKIKVMLQIGSTVNLSNQ